MSEGARRDAEATTETTPVCVQCGCECHGNDQCWTEFAWQGPATQRCECRSCSCPFCEPVEVDSPPFEERPATWTLAACRARDAGPPARLIK